MVIMGLKLASEKSPLERFKDGVANLREGTAKLYLRNLHAYCKWAGETPDSLYNFERRAWESRDNVDLLTIPNSVRDYMRHLVTDGGLASGTARTAAKAVCKFMKVNGFEWFRVAEQPRTDSKGQRIILRDQIRELNRSVGGNTRIRALIMVLKDTGLRVSDVAQLRCEDFRNAIKRRNEAGEEFRILADPTTTRKCGVNAHVHMGPESIGAVRDYIGDREEGALFITERGMPHKNDDGSTQPGEPMKSINVTTVLRTACKTLRQKGYKVSANSFRKFFLHTWEGAGFKDYGKIIAGKRLNSTDAPYTWAWETGELTDKYIELYDKLRVLEPDTEAHEKRIRELEAQLAYWTERFGDFNKAEKEDAEKNRRIENLEESIELFSQFTDAVIMKMPIDKQSKQSLFALVPKKYLKKFKEKE